MHSSGQPKEAPLSFKVVLLGDTNTGKSSLIHQFVHHEYLETMPTVGVDYLTSVCHVDDFTVRLNIFDTAGQERFLSVSYSYFRGADAALFVYALDSKESFASLHEWVARFDSSSDKRDTVKVLVGTKKDLIAFDEGQKEIRVVDREEVSQFLENYKMTFTFETSAKLNKNISKVFEELSRNLIFNTVEKRKYYQAVKPEEWNGLLKKDKPHLLRKDAHSDCC